MPVIPPKPLPRFDPVFLTPDDLDDLASFTGLTTEECRLRVHDYSMDEMASAWRDAQPGTFADMLSFYRNTDLYLWEQMQWHASRSREPYWRLLEALTEKFPPKAGYGRVLEFGAGIGTDALFLVGQGYEVSLVDVDGPAFRFARHRFERRGLEARFIESRGPLPVTDRMYDVVISFDVFEHLPDPLEAARRLVECLPRGGVLVQTGTFEDEGHHPCHVGESVHRFGGQRWQIHLAGLGLHGLGPNLLVRVGGIAEWVQRMRYGLWRATGLWLSHIPRR